MSEDAQGSHSLVGTVLEGMYRIVGLLGEGGMGAVYEGLHLRLQKRIAVKVMARELAANTEALNRFHREAMVTSALGHPHIVQVFDFSTTPTGEPFLVMEFLEGEDLEHRLRRAGRLSPPATLHVVKQVASALAATHAKGIVHRDLKPANIYLLEAAGETDFAKVLDFGISKVRTATTKLTKASMVMGTPNYMSPEQALGQVEEIDETTDQWALACIAWECLSGEGPFMGENVPAILFQVVHEAPPPLAPKVAGLPHELEEVLRGALAKDKRQRFASVAAFASALEGALAGISSAQAHTQYAPVSPTVRLSAAAAASPLEAKHSTTFTQTAGELNDSMVVGPTRRWRVWALGGGGATAVALAAFLLVGSGRVSKPGLAVPVASSPAPAAFAPPPAPVPAPAAEPPPLAVPEPARPAPATGVAEAPEPPKSLGKGRRIPKDMTAKPTRSSPAKLGPTPPPPAVPPSVAPSSAQPKGKRRLLNDL